MKKTKYTFEFTAEDVKLLISALDEYIYCCNFECVDPKEKTDKAEALIEMLKGMIKDE